MKASTHFGVQCPNGCFKTATMAVAGGTEALCNLCGAELVPVTDGSTRVIANFRCECGLAVGLLSVAGGVAKCRGCGKPI